MKKGRHRRFEEARALKRSDNVDLDGIFESLDDNAPSGVSDWEDVADEYSQWADVAAEYESKQADSGPSSTTAESAPNANAGSGEDGSTSSSQDAVEDAADEETSVKDADGDDAASSSPEAESA